MSGGLSIGDFYTAIELANKIRARFVDAPDQFKAISNEVRNLSNVLRDIDDVLPQRDLPTQRTIEFGQIIQGCHNVLRELEETLDKYQELDPDTKGFAGRSRRVWKRLRWDQTTIDGFRSRVTSNVLLFNTFLGQINTQTVFATKQGVDQLLSRQHDQDRQAILDWLTPIDYANQQSDVIRRRQEGTGQWLLDSDELRRWVDQTGQMLFCHGIPGGGKTMSAAIVIDKLFTELGARSDVGIAYVYCNFRQQHEQTPTDLLASLLKQLTKGGVSLPQSVRQLYETYQRTRTRPLINEVSQTLQSVVRDYSKSFIVVDAVDECRVTNGERNEFLAELFKLHAVTAANIFVTSRSIPEIEKEFEGRSTKLEIRATDEDLEKYLDRHILKLPTFISNHPDLQKEIRTAIVEAADGMFLLAQLHLDSLVGKPTPKAVRRALEKLPKGSEAYDQAYREAMERIESQVPDSVILAKQVLSWITYSRRPLKTQELQHALAVEVGQPELDYENLPEIAYMISVCAGLVIADEESNVLRLVHYTTQEFFERTKRDWFPGAEINIANVCISYLSFDIFEAGFCGSDEEFEARIQSNPLYDYAALSWGHHLRTWGGPYPEVKFLESEAKVSASSQALMALCEDPSIDYSQRVPKEMKGVHLAARFGLTEVMVLLLKRGSHSDSKNSHGRTPLSFAAEHGHEAVVRLLLDQDDVEADSKAKDGSTPLFFAAAAGYEAVVQLLVERDDVEADSKGFFGLTPLAVAAWNGYEAVVKLLVERNDVEANYKNGRTPLSLAADHGNEAVIKLLVERDDVEADSKETYSDRTPLSYAAEHGHEAAVRLLVERDDVETDSKSEDGRTPLSYAAQNGKKEVVRLLVERDDVEVNLQDDRGRTPLFYAAMSGHEAAVKLLIERDDAKVNLQDKWGRTPLSYAAEYRWKEVVKLLVERDDVEANLQDNRGRTPLSYAAEHGREEVVKLLVERGDVKTDSRDGEGRTPLSYAAEDGREEVVKVLLATSSIDINSKDNFGWTPLSLAASSQNDWRMEESSFEVVLGLLLADNYIDINSRDTNGRTALSWAAGEGLLERVEMLLAKEDIDRDIADNDGHTALWWAHHYRHNDVVKRLENMTSKPSESSG